MENASKALLIAAAVLVVIILVAVGMKIYSSTNGTQKVATDTGKSISDKAGDATDMAISAIKGEKYSPKVSIGTITKDNYGDYIDLGKDVIGTSATTDDWRVLYDDSANVYAILADYLPNNNPAIAESGLIKYNYNDFNVYDSSYSKNTFLNKLRNENKWKSLISENLVNNYNATVTGTVSGEILMASYNKKYGTNKDYTNRPYLRTNPNDSSSSIDTLYMPHPNSSGNPYLGCYGYWLASDRSIDGSSKVCYVGCNGRIGNYGCYETYYGIRPIVALPSNNMQVEKSTSNGTTIWKVVQ